MIWGEVINQVRSLHLQLLDVVAIPPQKFEEPFQFSIMELYFPKPTGNFNDWTPLSVPEILELHPVERVLLEGPLLPMDEVIIQNEMEANLIFKQILTLEREWLTRNQFTSAELHQELERAWKSQWLQFQSKIGLNRLKAV